eukprot:TRINITY_DN26910_c0_g1_i1.p1 TRINITY_DN26910_c0_g1~~TRINITY_DN26910_c0_g1_i1.p1  ORF type:complete len:229 (-),score=34.71 TRINITY_DN26910_c0_g1_i1:87-734(-)
MASSYIKDPLVTKDNVVDKRSLDGMSPVQEICNAISMFSPAVVGLVCWHDPPEGISRSARTAAVVLAVLLHLPFSVAYHILLARRELQDAIDNTPRKLDQVFIHISCIITTWSLSTSAAYSMLSTLLNIYFIFRLLCRSPDAPERMVNIFLGSLCYACAALLREDFWNFLWGGLAFTVGGGAMAMRVGGWGHCIMHLSLGGLTYCCLLSASKIQG